MTGFGKAEASTSTQKIVVEIRSINSKQADISLRFPQEIRHIELAARKRVIQKLQRGKIDIFISLEQLHTEPSLQLNSELGQKYWQLLKEFSEETHHSTAYRPLAYGTQYARGNEHRELHLRKRD